MGLPDSQKGFLGLVSEAAQGERVSFTTLYEQYVTPVYRYVLVRVKDKSLAEDITQTVFAKAFEHQRAFTLPDAKPLAYLYTVARNTLIDYWKKRREIQQTDAPEPFEKVADERKTPDELAEQTDARRQVLDALSRLTEEQREAVSLKYLNDLSVSEIANQMRKSEEAVRQLQSRGLKALRAFF